MYAHCLAGGSSCTFIRYTQPCSRAVGKANSSSAHCNKLQVSHCRSQVHPAQGRALSNLHLAHEATCKMHSLSFGGSCDYRRPTAAGAPPSCASLHVIINCCCAQSATFAACQQGTEWCDNQHARHRRADSQHGHKCSKLCLLVLLCLSVVLCARTHGCLVDTHLEQMLYENKALPGRRQFGAQAVRLVNRAERKVHPDQGMSASSVYLPLHLFHKCAA